MRQRKADRERETPYRSRDPKSNIPDAEAYTSRWRRLFEGGPPSLSQLPADDPLVHDGRLTEAAITRVVDLLRTGTVVREPTVVAVAELMFQLVHHRVIPCAMLEGAASPHFAVLGTPDPAGEALELMAFFAFPPCWWKDLLSHPRHEMAAVLFVASDARDFWSGKIVTGDRVTADPDDSRQRGRALEAQFLRALEAQEGPGDRSDWLEACLKDYPEGLASLRPGLWYEHRPFTPPEQKRPARRPSS